MIPKISVIIPFYNSKGTVEKTLSSVEQQTFYDFEVILIDDGSTDGSLDICEKYAKDDKRIRIYHQKNQGPGCARNYGIELAKGEYLIFLDSDDFWEPDLLSTLYERALLTNADMTACRFWIFNDEIGLDQDIDWDVNLSLIKKPFLFNPHEYPQKIFQLFNTAPWFSLYNRSFIIKNNICFSPWIRSEDNLFTMGAIAMAEKVSVVNRRLIHYRVNSNQKLENKIINLWQNTFKAFVQVRKYLETKKVFEQFRESFINCELSQIKSYLLELAPYPVKSFIEHKISQQVIPEFDLINRDDKLFENWTNKYWLFPFEKKKNYSDLLEKQFYEKRNLIVPVVYTVSSETFLNTIISIESIKEHKTPDHFYDIYVLHADLTSEWQAKLESLSESNIRVTCVSVYHSIPESIKNWAPVQKEKTYLCFLDKVIDGYDKILCLSPDTIVFCDLAELSETDMKDNLLAASVKESQNKNVSSLFDSCHISPTKMILDNVMLINFVAWKKQNIGKQLLNLLLDSNAPRCEILTIGCQHRILPLDTTWNQYIFPSDNLITSSELKKNKIINYTPPTLNQNSDLFGLWWSLAQRSSCFEALLLRGVKKGMINNLPGE